MKREELTYDDFKLKNPLVPVICIQIFQRFNPQSAGTDSSRQNLTSKDVRF